MRQAYIVTYDVCDPGRLRRVFKTMRGFGQHLQLSVFRCELDAKQLVELKTKLRDIIHATEDQVLLIDIGPADGRAGTAVEALGKPYVPSERRAVVV